MATHRSSVSDLALVVPGMVVSNCGVWFRTTHTVDGVWHGVRFGPMSREAAEQHEQRPGTCVWPIPRPFLWEEP